MKRKKTDGLISLVHLHTIFFVDILSIEDAFDNARTGNQFLGTPLFGVATSLT
jgi:hypothetical protein